MNKIKTILAPTDLSELSQAGVRYALNLARAFGADVTLYHVVSYDELIQYGQEMKEKAGVYYDFRPSDSILARYRAALSRFLRDHFSDLSPWVKIREKVEMGRADENIVEEAEKEGVDLIVLSTHGRTGLSHILVGSVTEKVVRHAPCPVLSIRPQMDKPAAREATKPAEGLPL